MAIRFGRQGCPEASHGALGGIRTPNLLIRRIGFGATGSDNSRLNSTTGISVSAGQQAVVGSRPGLFASRRILTRSRSRASSWDCLWTAQRPRNCRSGGSQWPASLVVSLPFAARSPVTTSS
jgi:hypothetical protein